MENPQAQMPQGQPAPAPEQMQQGQPQQGGQDPQMQQIMQFVQQMMQQGIQPVEAAAQLLSKQVPPELIMQVFVQMGMPQESAQQAIEQAMQGGQQPQQQNQGEEQMEGQASNPQEEYAEQGSAQQGMAEAGDSGQMAEPSMAYGGRMPRRLKKYENGAAVDPNQELQGVMQQVQEMIQGGADAKQVMAQIQQAAQQGQISPETAAAVMEQLGGMQQASNPQGDDATMTAESQDPQVMDPNLAAPDQQMGMARFGGNLKSLLKKAYGGPMTPPAIESKDYARDRTSMFVNAVKNNAYKSTLDDEFPSLSGNQMAYGGIPKALNGIEMKDGVLTINPKAYKTEADYKAAIYDWNNDPANANNQVTSELFTANKWTQQPDKNATYKYDEATGSYIAQPNPPSNGGFAFQAGDVLGQDAQGNYVTRADGTMQRIPGTANSNYNIGYGAVNPVAYQNPMGNGLYGNLYAGASPFARMVSGFSMNKGYDPRITGANLPGGMSAEQFLGAVGPNGLVPGMAGNVNGQDWRIGEAEKFKEGSIWKGNRRKGVRYQIDWGTPGATNTQAGVNPQLTANGPATWNNADYNNNGIPDYLQEFNGSSSTGTTQPGIVAGPAAGPTTTTTTTPTAITPLVDNSPTATGDKDKWDRKAERELRKQYDDSSYKDLEGNERKQAVAEEFKRRTDANDMRYNTTTNGTDANGDEILYDRKDFNSDRGYYKALFPELGRKEIKNLAKTYSLGEDPWDLTHDSNPSTVYDSRKDMRQAKRGKESRQDMIDRFDKNASSSNEITNTAYTPHGYDDGSLFDRKDYNSDRAYYKDLYSGLGKKEIKNLAKNFNLGEDPYEMKGNIGENYEPQTVYGSRKEMRQARRDSRNAPAAAVTPTAPVTTNATVDPFLLNESAPLKNYGGGIDPMALNNAINLINRAFGGMIPMAENGNMGNQGTIEQSNGKKLNIDWRQVAGAAGDMYMNGATRATSFFNDMNDYNPERDQTKYSALNRPSDTYDTMSQGIYDQAGNFITNDVGNEVLNSTNTGYNNQRQIFAYGGRLYEIGGDVDLNDNEVEELRRAGIKLSRV